MWNSKNLIGMCLVVILALSAIYNPFTAVYLHELRMQKDNGAVQVGVQKDELNEAIEEASKKYSFPPQDARIDRVWKAIPGYNGLKVDQRSSHKKMKKNGFDERKLVFSKSHRKFIWMI